MASKLQIREGERFGKLTYVQDAPTQVLPSGQKPRRALCICDCGRQASVLLLHLVRGRTKSCSYCFTPSNRTNQIGCIYGLLTIVSELPDRISPNGVRKRMFEAVCSCGSQIKSTLENIKDTKSCGCLGIDKLRSMHTTHGLTSHRLYGIWQNMKNRCYNQTTDSYPQYGGKGIVVCDEWKNNFLSFYLWAVLHGYKPHLTIDRYPDFRGNYEPSNCRWATDKQQQNNKSSNVLYELYGKKLTLAEICDIYGLDYKKTHRAVKLRGKDNLRCLINDYSLKLKLL